MRISVAFRHWRDWVEQGRKGAITMDGGSRDHHVWHQRAVFKLTSFSESGHQMEQISGEIQQLDQVTVPC
ncbi:hypothetical protein L1887_08280 [Cichorium endivia]|nr:hypothetical protein L1887_08280 [Cichorium endivia]